MRRRRTGGRREALGIVLRRDERARRAERYPPGSRTAQIPCTNTPRGLPLGSDIDQEIAMDEPTDGRVLYDRRDRHLRGFVRDAIRRSRKAGYLTDVRSVHVLDERFRRMGYRCYWCGGPFECVDHRKALVLGGRDLLRNLVPSCAPCNSLKRDLPLSLWRPIAARRKAERSAQLRTTA